MLNPSVEPTARRESFQAMRDDENKERRASSGVTSPRNDHDAEGRRSSNSSNGVSLRDGADLAPSDAAVEARKQRRSTGLKVPSITDAASLRGVISVFRIMHVPLAGGAYRGECPQTFRYSYMVILFVAEAGASKKQVGAISSLHNNFNLWGSVVVPFCMPQKTKTTHDLDLHIYRLKASTSCEGARP